MILDPVPFARVTREEMVSQVICLISRREGLAPRDTV